MTTPLPILPLACGHPVTSLVEIAHTLFCRECQDDISRHLILTLEAQTENKEVHVVTSEDRNELQAS
jgi:hypothetical protein